MQEMHFEKLFIILARQGVHLHGADDVREAAGPVALSTGAAALVLHEPPRPVEPFQKGSPHRKAGPTATLVAEGPADHRCVVLVALSHATDARQQRRCEPGLLSAPANETKENTVGYVLKLLTVFRPKMQHQTVREKHQELLCTSSNKASPANKKYFRCTGLSHYQVHGETAHGQRAVRLHVRLINDVQTQLIAETVPTEGKGTRSV